MEFKAEVNLEYKDFLAWNKVYAKTSAKKKNTVVNILLVVLTLIMLVSVLLLIAVDGLDSTVITCLVVFTIALVIKLFGNRINAKMAQKSYLKNAGTQYLSFGDEALFINNRKGEAKYYYSGIIAFYTDGERYFLLIDDRHANVIPKKCFVDGEPHMFPAFICEKTGLEMKEIKC